MLVMVRLGWKGLSALSWTNANFAAASVTTKRKFDIIATRSVKQRNIEPERSAPWSVNINVSILHRYVLSMTFYRGTR